MRQNPPTDSVTVIGAGLAGLASAWFLRKAGFGVHVVDKRSDVGLETSFANGGMLTPSMSDPWNAPGVHWQLLRWLGRKDAPMLLRPGALHHYIGWGLKFMAHSRPDRHRAALEANLALSVFSMETLRELRKKLSLSYAQGTRGNLKIYRNRESFDAACSAAEHLHQHGLEFAPQDAAGVVRIEPQLADIQNELAGGIHFPGDETGDSHLFCQELKRELQASGVTFSFDTEVRSIVVENGTVQAVDTRLGPMSTRCVVLAAAAHSPKLAAPHGIKLHIRPVKGYSLSVPVAPEQQYSVAIIDDALHAAATPLGPVLRVAGTAEFAGFNATLDPGRIENLWNLLKALSPAIHAKADRASTPVWCGFRPMAADGRAYIGATPVSGLFVNCGHGHLGWTQALGSGDLLRRLIAQDPPSISPIPFGLRRA